MRWHTIWTMHKAIISLTLFLLLPPLVSLAQPSNDEATETRRRISVRGVGTARAKPDVAQIQLGVTTGADSATAALKENNKAMEEVHRVLKKHGVAEKHIQTINFRISPQYDQDKQTTEVVGYQVQNQVHARVQEISSLGRILDDAVSAGANNIHSIQFSLDQREQLTDQARRQAVKNAHGKAQALAEAAGVRLGRVLQINEQSSPSPRGASLEVARATDATSVPIAQGQETIQVNVAVTYELAGERSQAPLSRRKKN